MVLSEEAARSQGTPALDITELLQVIVDREASDLHLTAGTCPVIRIHGHLERLDAYPVLDGPSIRQMVYSILTQRQRERFEQNLELDLSHSIPGVARFRMNVYFQKDNLGAAFRLIPRSIRSASELGLPQQILDFAALARGMVLITGPTGQGKTTTLATIIDRINSEREVHIVTVEDPIEFVHDHKRSIVNQREVGVDTQSFANALRHALRQDPDVILVGEMRDLETIQIALTAAETGHLVFATLHTQDAAQTVDRIIDVFPPHQQEQVRVQLAGSLQGIVTQQLLPLSNGTGRAVAAEVLVATPAVRNLIREGKTHQMHSTMQSGGKFGMQTMDQALAELVKGGKISFEMAQERAHDPQVVKQLLGR